MHRKAVKSCAAVAALILFTVAVAGLAPARGAHAATTLTVRAGGGEPGYAVNAFLARDIRVNTGDSVKWSWSWFEPHTVTFGRPAGDPTVPSDPGKTSFEFDGSQYISTGLVGGQFGEGKLEVKFTKAGAYSYFCAIHANMGGTVTVTADQVADNQRSIDNRGDAEYSSALINLKNIGASLAAAQVSVTPQAGGGSRYTIVTGGENAEGDVMQFFTPVVKIRPGDSVQWKSSVEAPHTVTFGELRANPLEAPATKLTGAWDGAGLLHSGLLGKSWPGGPTYEVKFAKSGTYKYVCVLHADQGMVGTVEVASAPGAPNTGTGLAPLAGQPEGEGAAAMLAAALGVIAMGGLATVAARRSRG